MKVDIVEPFNRLHLRNGPKITALLFLNEKLYLGFSNGDLTIMRVSPEAEQAQPASRSMRSLNSFSEIKRLFSGNDDTQLLLNEKTFHNVTLDNNAIISIEYLPIFKDNSREILLVGKTDALFVCEWVGAHLNLVSTFKETRGYSKVLYTETADAKLLLIAVRKKLSVHRVFQKSRNIFEFVDHHESKLAERIKDLELFPNSHRVLIATQNSFASLDLDTFKIRDLDVSSTSSGAFAQSATFGYFGLAGVSSSVKMLNTGKNVNLIIKDSKVGTLTYSEGTYSIDESKIKLSAAPLDAAFVAPCYALFLYSKKFEIVEITSGDVLQLFQHLLNSSAVHLSLNEKLVFLSSGFYVFQFNVLPYQKQLDQFTSMRGTSGASRGIKGTRGDLRLLGLEKAITLVSHIAVDDDIFENSSRFGVNKDLAKQLYLRGLQKERAEIMFSSYSRFHEALVEIGSEWLLSYKDVLPMFPDFLNGDCWNRCEMDQESHPSYIQRITEEDLQNVKRSNLELAAESEIESVSAKDTHRLHKFSKAVNNLIVFLTDQRRIHGTFMSSQEDVPTFAWKGVQISVQDIYPEINTDKIQNDLESIFTSIDTSLFLCYYYMKPMLLGPLLRLPNNHCSAEVVNERLLSGVHAHAPGLDLHIRELLDFYYCRGLHEDALKMLHKLSHQENNVQTSLGREFTADLSVSYMLRLANKDLDIIFAYAKWVILAEEALASERALQIFMNNTVECETYDNLKVYDFLRVDCQREDIAVQYLEWLINESDILSVAGRENDQSNLSTILCLAYLDLLEALDVGDEAFYQDTTYKKLYSFLEQNQNYEPWKLLKRMPTSEDRFLRLTIFIYRRLGEHQKSVDVFYNQLNDLDGAMEYCASIHAESGGEQIGRELLHKLLEDLLMYYDENKHQIARLLSTQGDKMAVLQVLTILPSTFPVNFLIAFLQDSVQMSESRLMDSRITSQLYKLDANRLHHDLLEARSANVLVSSENNKCHVCGRKIDLNSLCIDPDQKLVHFTCASGSAQENPNMAENGVHAH